jgi:Ca2+/Na+ antiporter
MTNSSDNSRRGYFNALTAGYFKTGADGRRFFFPWGAMGRGYLIPTEQRYESMHRQLKIYMIATLVLIIPPIAAQFYFTGVIISVALMIFYLGWARFLKRGLEPSDERMTVGGNIATQARNNIGMLWTMEIAAVLFVAAGIAMLVFEPKQWIMSLFSTVFFGFCATVIGRMIMLRRRETARQA